ncbi:helicase-related protein [Saccharibacter sp. 17.LH.SD]|uniref:helicase-related protein n=1 Tax=Saccharibacter sp. 17.LH.SD TaxID=2689393 RepID=UPI001F2CA58D|nr:helicase-related protein [Saccharibacter sp. 17.LH.SD]
MPATIHAMLGPTNTGKTHYALSRMIAHQSGIIGFPLRLLARENYERLVKLKGEKSVALLTGEEKIIPPRARWFSCTVEAMPLDRKVDFIAIDEIQLAADPDRGHVFTDRLLHARGEHETLFLGAETIRNLLKKLIPEIEIETRNRLSQLTYTGSINLTRLPPRSAIVAFSANEVYAIAEAIRQKRGGCAVIMGRLSPRTRNAQIELYQNREVDYLVATDAIGMGLNMDVNHVALASLKKFDGTVSRPLTPQEVAQIAGRAGRGMKDGTFGTTTGTCSPMPVDMVNAIEEHRFDPIRQLYWRQTKLDYKSPEALLTSLMNKPPHPGLITGRIASDLDVLTTLISLPEIRQAARGHKATQLLWEACQIPDFRKIGDGSHARLCGRLFLDRLHHGHIPPNWIEGQLRGLDRTDGDIDTLMHRLSGVRVCAYIAARSGWLRNSTRWQEKSRDVEDRLSDTLHERLAARFINKRATALLRRSSPGEAPDYLSAITSHNRLIVEGHDIGRIAGFSLEIDAPTDSSEGALLLRAGRRALRHAMPNRIQNFLKEKEDKLVLKETGKILWEGTEIARLTKGNSFFEPSIRLLPGEFQDMTQSQRVSQHLTHMTTLQIKKHFHILFETRQKWREDPNLRGLFHRLIEDGGITPTLANDSALPHVTKKRLHKLGITVGQRFIFYPSLLKPDTLPTLTLLYNLWHNASCTAPSAGELLLPQRHTITPPGWAPAGSMIIRIDMMERFLNRLMPHGHPPRRSYPAPADLASSLGIKKSMLAELLKHLKVPHRPPSSLPHNQYGPPSPLLILGQSRSRKKHAASSRRKNNRISAKKPERLLNSPFAALAKWTSS